MRGALLAGLLLLAAAPAGAQTVERIRERGQLDCAVVTGAEDWNGEDQHGDLSPLGRALCRAVAVAMLGPEAKLAVHGVPAEPEAIADLRRGDVDVVMGVSPSAQVAMRQEVEFGPPFFWDTQRVLVSARSGITALSDLAGQLVCAPMIGPVERVLRETMTARGIPYGLQAHSELGELDAAIAVRRCAAGSGLESRLAQARAEFPAAAGAFVFLPDRLTLDPVAPAVRAGDRRFALIVSTTLSALVEAEALGITRANIGARHEGMRADRLLGRDFATADALGLAHDWSRQVIAAVGNYGEVFADTLGAAYHLDRGLNALWTDGGLMRPLPLQ